MAAGQPVDDPSPAVQVESPDAPLARPSATIDSLRALPAYHYDRRTPRPTVSWWDRLVQRLGKWLGDLFDVDAPGTARQVRWLLYGLAALLLVWALRKLLRMDFSRATARADADATPAADLADAARPPDDLSALMREAAASGRYREAVRWQYLRLLGAMGRARLLDLQPSKTNRRYRAEVARHAVGPAFERASRLFDRVVYGGVELDAATYQAVAGQVGAAEEAVEAYAGDSQSVAV
jgi:hypothetical protein